MFEFNYYCPTKILFGKNKIENLIDQIKKDDKSILLVCGKSAELNGTLDIIKNNLKDFSIYIFNEVTTNPSEQLILKGVNIVKENNCKTIISIGGGSSHDTAKAISLLATHDGKLVEYTVTGTKSVPGINDILIPVITIPTIPGTGAEISPAALVRVNNAKSIIYSPFLYPKASIIDLDLINPQSPELIVNVGIDAFFQGFEAFVSSNANIFSNKFAKSAIINSIIYLPKYKRNPNDIEAKAYTTLASLDSLFAVAASGVGGIHALSDPLSGIYNIPHGIAQTIVAKEVVRYNINSFKEKLPELINMFSTNKKYNSENIVNIFLDLFDNFIDSLGITTSQYINDVQLSDINFTKLAEDSQNPDIQTNPCKISNDDIINIFKKIFIKA